MTGDHLGGPAAENAQLVWIDQASCTGDGLCVERVPELFRMDTDGLAYVQDELGVMRQEPGSQVSVPQDLEEATRRAAEDCPGSCIYLA